MESLTHAVRSFTANELDRDREALSASEQASRREAETANRAKDVFLATLSHEMRTPLNAIVGWLSILRHESAEPRHFQEGIEGHPAQHHGASATGSMTSWTCPGSSPANYAWTSVPCELADVINAGVNATRTAAEARGITLTVRLDPSGKPAPWCDGVRIQQVVWNLVSNAVKFTPKGGQVDVTLDREQSSFQIKVRDTGQGISSEFLPQGL